MWVTVPATPVLLVPSPQWTIMPVPLIGMAMVWLAASVFQVVTNGSWSGACCAWASANCPGMVMSRPVSAHPPAWAKGKARAADAASRMAYTMIRMAPMDCQIYKCLRPAGFLGIICRHPCLANCPPRFGAARIPAAEGRRIPAALRHGAHAATALAARGALPVVVRHVSAHRYRPRQFRRECGPSG